MLAYCVATNVRTAVLIYPRETEAGPDSIVPILVHNTDIRVLGLSIDLSGSASGLSTELDLLTTRLVSLSGETK